MTEKKAAEPEATTELLSAVLDSAPDERLFIACGCRHRAALHDNNGCHFVTAGKPGSTSYNNTTPATPDVPCPCPTPREVVYISGRVPVEEAVA